MAPIVELVLRAPRMRERYRVFCLHRVEYEPEKLRLLCEIVLIPWTLVGIFPDSIDELHSC